MDKSVVDMEKFLLLMQLYLIAIDQQKRKMGRWDCVVSILENEILEFAEENHNK